MCSINYSIKSISQDESQNLNNCISNIRQYDLYSFWQSNNIFPNYTIDIEFEKSYINQIVICINKSCDGIYITLNLIEDNVKTKDNQLEMVKGHQEEKKLLINVPYKDQIFNSIQFQLENKKDQMKIHGIYYIQLFGRPYFQGSSQKLNLYQQSQVPQKFGSSQVVPNNDKTSIFYQRNSNQKQSQLLVRQSSPFQNKNNLTPQQQKSQISKLNFLQDEHKSKDKQQTQDSFSFEEQFDEVIKQSLDTYDQEEIQRKLFQKSEIDLLEKVQKKEEINFNKEKIFEKIVISIETPLVHKEDDIDFDDMYDLNQSMIMETLQQCQHIVEESRYGKCSFNDRLQSNYRCLRGIHFYITSNISGKMRSDLIERGEELGAQYYNDINRKVNLIISTDVHRYDFSEIRKLGLPIVNQQFILNCFNRKYPNIKNFMIL